MAMEAMRSERFLVVVKAAGPMLPAFPAGRWLAVEVFESETEARARFRALRIPLQVMKAGAVLVRALTTMNCEKIHVEKVIVSRDAEFWELQLAEVQRARPSQQEEWDALVSRILSAVEIETRSAAKQATEAVAKAAARRTEKAEIRQSLRFAASLFLVFTAGGLAVGVMRSGATVAETEAAAQAHDGSMTIIMPDPTDPRMSAEWMVKRDGTRTLVRRMPREFAGQPAGPRTPATAAPDADRPQPKSLVDAVNGFFSYRQ